MLLFEKKIFFWTMYWALDETDFRVPGGGKPLSLIITETSEQTHQKTEQFTQREPVKPPLKGPKRLHTMQEGVGLSATQELQLWSQKRERELILQW